MRRRGWARGMDGVTDSETAGETIGSSGSGTAGRPRLVGRPDGATRVATLRERWFACSCALGWTAAAEWPDVRDWRRAPLTIAGEAAGVVFDAGESIAVVGRGTLV